jgi:hypothetical protein
MLRGLMAGAILLVGCGREGGWGHGEGAGPLAGVEETGTSTSALSSAGPPLFTDGFDRTTLGPSWTVARGRFTLSGSAAHGGQRLSYAFWTGTPQTDGTVSVTVTVPLRTYAGAIARAGSVLDRDHYAAAIGPDSRVVLGRRSNYEYSSLGTGPVVTSGNHVVSLTVLGTNPATVVVELDGREVIRAIDRTAGLASGKVGMYDYDGQATLDSFTVHPAAGPTPTSDGGAPRSDATVSDAQAPAPDAPADLGAADTRTSDASAPDIVVAPGPTPVPAPGAPTISWPGGPQATMTLIRPGYAVRAVDRSGIAYAIQLNADDSVLWTSNDNLRSVQTLSRGYGAFAQMQVLSSGALLADLVHSEDHSIARSADGGRTWQKVLATGSYRMLQPGNIAELGGTVFFGEYQTVSQLATLHLWASQDEGRTWAQRQVWNGYRHVHGVIADPTRNELWAILGDPTGGLFRSRNLGQTFTEVINAPDGVGVHAALNSRGLIYGTDAIFAPATPGIVQVARDDTYRFVASLPGPAYSIMRHSSGVLLMGITNEPSGDLYPGEVNVYLFGSYDDGVTWQQLLRLPRNDRQGFARLDVRWELPTGEVVIELENVQLTGGGGYALLALRPR